VLDVAILLLAGTRLSLFNLVALLLVVGIGLNYALFFNRPAPGADERQRTLLSLAVCGATTLSAFGCLAFSQTPVLRAIGITVTLGTLLSLLISAALSAKPDRPHYQG
jgi:predicted exporter